MKTVGIICEYNPFHFGHLRQIQMIRQQLGEDTIVICVMSGNYVQRGTPAMWDKYTRAHAAVDCGADLVLELPITKVLQSAEGFARGGVEILSKLNCVDYLCFGAECGDAQALMRMAEKLDSEESNTSLTEYLSHGLPYAAARQAAVNDHQNLLASPNNILGVEYCRALISLNSSMKPLVIQRNGDYHDRIADAKEPSATAVRELYPDGNWHSFVPQEAAVHFAHAYSYDLSHGERAVLSRLRSLSDEEWRGCAHGSEGLWSKAMKASRSQRTLEAIIDATKSKRYPRTRIQRLIMCAYLGITQKDLSLSPSFCRLLAASEAGRSRLRTIRQEVSFPITNPGQAPHDSYYYRLETKSSDLFTLFCSENNFPCQTDQDARLRI